MSGKHWKLIVQEKQAERTARIAEAATLSKQEATPGALLDEQYLHSTATQIVENIRNDLPGWTAENVMGAYIRRAAKAHEKTNCITEVMFKQALNEARALDNEHRQTGKIRGPLHGIPFSLKDMITVKGYDACIGFTNWSQQPCTTDAEVVKQIRAAGGIPFVKTNVPQTMLSFECANPVWGRSLNPYSDKHTCGGSSGGEAALVACDGSALGIGSDVGGSLRIPAGFCGVYSLKPSTTRISGTGARGCVPGFEAIRTGNGPLARSVEDVELLCRTLFGKSSEAFDTLPPVPYRDVQLHPKLKFGYYKSDDIIKTSPAAQRAVQEAVDALRKQGHECVEFEVPNVLEAARLFVALTSADGYATLTSHISPDPRDPALSLATLGPRLPGFVRAIVVWAARWIMRDEIFAHLMSNSCSKTVGQFWAETQKRNNYRQFFYEEVWDKHAFDGIICPVNAFPSIPHGGTANLSPLCFATTLYNILDDTVGIVPVTRVDPIKDATSPEWESSSPKGSPFLYNKMYGGTKPPYDPTLMQGIPVGVQVVGRRWEEEKVIEMMKVVDDALGKRGFGPGAWNRDA